MSMFSRCLTSVVPMLWGLLLCAPIWAQTPDLGEPVAAVPAITVFPDGQGLPAGQGDVASGAALYTQHCLACHGERGRDGLNDTLVGGQMALDQMPVERTVGSYWPYAPSLFDYVRRAMPYRAPGSLSNDEVYALVAYLLYLNGILPAVSQLDAATLPQVTMPARPRFYSDYPIP